MKYGEGLRAGQILLEAGKGEYFLLRRTFVIYKGWEGFYESVFGGLVEGFGLSGRCTGFRL